MHPDDRDLQQFLVRNDKGQIEDWRMTCVTFGMTSSLLHHSGKLEWTIQMNILLPN